MHGGNVIHCCTVRLWHEGVAFNSSLPVKLIPRQSANDQTVCQPANQGMYAMQCFSYTTAGEALKN